MGCSYEYFRILYSGPPVLIISCSRNQLFVRTFSQFYNYNYSILVQLQCTSTTTVHWYNYSTLVQLQYTGTTTDYNYNYSILVQLTQFHFLLLLISLRSEFVLQM